MKKFLYIVLAVIVILGGFFIYRWWQSKQRCPVSDPAGLYNNCIPHIEGGTAQNPLNI